jgi:hypothetical protein
MFRLIKLAIYGVLGYAIYEFARGLMAGDAGSQRGSAGKQGSKALNQALDRGGNRVNMTGPGRGERVDTAEPTGESVPHVVGRGVVHQ